ncbi:MAG: response regulator transcription factor [Lachnospiraceae bacterium]|nr:response regulator transcription factor [Lachnospiraceae bacterium]
MMNKILIIEDEESIATLIKMNLIKAGYQCDVAFDGAEGADKLSENHYDLCLLDIMLPEINGYELLSYAKSLEVPVMFVTAKGETQDKVKGLKAGADDYITKPYRVKELLSRIAANIRRFQYKKTEVPDTFYFGKHQFRIVEFRLFYENTPVECTASELRLLKELVQNEGQVLSRRQLLERLYDSEESFVDDNTLSVYMKRLRSKLGEDAWWIETVRGIGYRFRRKA